MSCYIKFEELIAYADGEMTGKELLEMESHIRLCDVCSQRIEKLAAMQSCLQDSLSEPINAPSVDFLLPDSARPKTRKPAWSWAMAAAIVFIAVAGWLFIEKPSQYQPTASQPAVNTKHRIHTGVAQKKIDLASTEVAEQPHKNIVAKKLYKSNIPAKPKKQIMAKTPAVEPEQELPDQSADPMPTVVTEVREEPASSPDGYRTIITTTKTMVGKSVVRKTTSVSYILPPNRDAESIDRPDARMSEAESSEIPGT